MLKIAQFYQALIFGGLFFNSMQGMSLSTIMTKLTKSPQSQHELLIQSKDLSIKPYEPSKIATKLIIMKHDAKNMIRSHLDTIENTKNLKQKLACTEYDPIIFDLEAGFNKTTMPAAGHLADESGQITKLAAKFVEFNQFLVEDSSTAVIGRY